MSKKIFSREKPHLNVGTLGHVDHGKTTLTSAITYYLSKNFPFAANIATDYASIDSTPEERDRGVTINATCIDYETPLRHYGHVDCPGHADYVKNMITGATNLDGAILVVDGFQGVSNQTREHVYLARQLNIKKIIVFINKADMVSDSFDLEVVEMDIQNLLTTNGFMETPVIVGSALSYLNDGKYEEPMKQLIETMDNYFENPQRDLDMPFKLPIEKVMKKSGRGTIVTGRVIRGVVTPGTYDLIGFNEKGNQKIVIKSIESFHSETDKGLAGDNVGVLVNLDKNSVETGQVIAAPNTLNAYVSFESAIYVLKPEEGGRLEPFRQSYQPQVFLDNARSTIHSMKFLPNQDDIIPENALPGDNLNIRIVLQKRICIEVNSKFTLREGGKTIAAGTVTKLLDMYHTEENTKR